MAADRLRYRDWIRSILMNPGHGGMTTNQTRSPRHFLILFFPHSLANCRLYTWNHSLLNTDLAIKTQNLSQDSLNISKESQSLETKSIHSMFLATMKHLGKLEISHASADVIAADALLEISQIS
jgi:hypothetical protein